MTEIEALEKIKIAKFKKQIGLELSDVIIYALEKQISKKPIDVISRTNGKIAKCPICNCKVLRMQYCERCGQKLDWSDTD